MKLKLIAFVARTLRPFAVLVYALIKLVRPTRHKATFISRQSDSTPLDFTLLATELSSQDRSLEIKMLCCSDATRSRRLFGNVRQTLRELWHIAQSSAVILDGYALSVSYFPQRRNLYVLQMWHALGAIKRFSWQAVDTPGGRSSAIARALRMHANYTALLVSGQASVEIYRHAFRTARSRIHVLPLPRADYLLAPDLNRTDYLIANNPDFFKRGPLIFYAPTFRDSDEASQQWLTAFRALLTAVESVGATLVLKTHMREHRFEDASFAETANSSNLILNPDIDTLDLLSLVDHVITDYSAVAFEAAVGGKPLWFYLPDYDDYSTTRGLNFDVCDYMPDACFTDPTALISALCQTTLPSYQQAQFLTNFVQLSKHHGVSNAKQIARLVLKGIQ